MPANEIKRIAVELISQPVSSNQVETSCKLLFFPEEVRQLAWLASWFNSSS